MTVNLMFFYSTIICLIANFVVPSLRIGPIAIDALVNTRFHHHDHHHCCHRKEQLHDRISSKAKCGFHDSTTKNQKKSLQRNIYVSSTSISSSVTDLMALLDREESGYDHTGKIIKSQLGESEIESNNNDNNMEEEKEYYFTDVMALLDGTEEREYSQFDMSESDSDDSTEEEEIEEEEASVTGIMDLLEKGYSNNQYDHIDIIQPSQIVGGESEIDNSDGIMEEEEEEEEGEKDDLFISDAEALLACWGHLKRRKLYGNWTEHEQRQAQKGLSQTIFLPEDDDFDDDSEDDDDDDDDDDEDDDDDDDDMNEYDSDYDRDDDDDDEDDEWSSCSTSVQDVLLACNIADDIYESRSANDVDMDYAIMTGDLAAIDTFTATGGTTKIWNDNTNYNNEYDRDDSWYKEFTSFPTEPSDSRIRRVNAIKKRWEDPTYREQWYQKRWGNLSNHQKKNQQQTVRERKAIIRARDLPSEFLGSDELALMEEDEIANAIMTRLESTRKRVASRKQTFQRRRDVLEAQMLKAQTLPEDNAGDDGDDSNNIEETFSPNKELMVEVQRKRSERAKRLYATRLKNQEEENKNQSELLSSSSTSSSSMRTIPSPRNKGPFFPPKQLTPRDALLRIENSLDSGKTISLEDFKLILLPERMKNRKPIISRILKEEFNLGGKCVPPIINDDDDDNNYELEFVRQCTIERLGTFVISLLEK
jgi:hypothetical protein